MRVLRMGKENKAMPKEMSLMRKQDILVLWIFLSSWIACAAVMAILSFTSGSDITQTAVILSAPFFTVGVYIYYQYRKWMYVLAIIALDVALYFLEVPLILIFFISFTFVGAAGVVAVIVFLQRYLFYRIISIVEYVNVKEKLSIKDRIVVFFFNIPKDLDTRNVTMNYNLKRASIPWNELIQTVSFGLMIGMFLWIYIIMNPASMDATTLQSVPATMFTLVLFIPILVLPWTIFKSLRVRVETRYRDFLLHDGIKETLKRMAVPIFASFLYIFVAVNETGLDVVLMFILLSVVFNVVVIGLTCVFFYVMFEAPLVEDIVSRWKVFRPVSLTMDVGNDSMAKELPATPKRDLGDYGELEFMVKK